MIRVDYAGPGGACEGIRSLGLESYGIEWDAAACATRAAAGHLTIRADLSTYRPGGSPEGYWSSPPCQTFSTAGKGEGRGHLDALAEVILAERWVDADLFDDRTRHVIDAARTAVELHPEWIAMEQVPAVLPLWRALALVLERHGYSAWCGVLCAADYGVPQTRRRAILMASRTRCANPPPPTHAEHPGMFGEAPWVSMADALGWTGDLDRRQTGAPVVTVDRPAPTLTGIAGSKSQWIVNTRGDRGDAPAGGNEFGADRPSWALTGKARSWDVRLSPGLTETQPNRRTYGLDEPAPTVAFGNDAANWCWERPSTTVVSSFRPDVIAAPGWRGPGDGPRQDAEGSVRITVREALILQGFPPDYPVQGSRTKQFEQVGNAVPPPLAAAVVGALVGAEVMERAS